jgi:hypothetical protein
MSKEAMNLALEALEGVLDDAPKVLDASIAGGLYEVVQCRDAITAIKEVLAQPEQEPVGWLDSNDKLAEFMHKDLKAEHDKRDSSTPRAFQIPVYTTPPQRKPPQFPTMLRKMWSGREVQDWINENWNKGEA